ncbi:hypothetical protein Metal_3750 [Methylomicrobium album BG8]|uniref:Uncharacterized protein n=1 Tax=Methylomicrobium album BG8 TaxID=686340 RepID=H8GHS7_METAL|nr:hypothetical protein Metal_3750 [Methylomicrobium album BG8]
MRFAYPPYTSIHIAAILRKQKRPKLEEFGPFGSYPPCYFICVRNYASALTFAFNLLLLRAALFLWIRPLFTAESMTGTAVL